jgi:hypothetical protein
MPSRPRAAIPALLIPLILAACGGTTGQGPVAGNPDTSPLPAATRAEGCRMRGAVAEDQAVGPLGQVSIDSGILRQQVVDACMRGGAIAPTATLPPSPFSPR